LYRPDGRSIEALSKKAVCGHLLDGVENRFHGRDILEQAKK
jgi:hypothetical protein